MASADGASRTGAIPSEISNSSPSTNRPAFTLPWRCRAARSGRAGVRRGSSIAFSEQSKDGARGLAFASLGTCRLRRRGPAIDVDMQPCFRALDEALQEQRAGDGAGEGARGRVVDGGDFRVEPGIIS